MWAVSTGDELLNFNAGWQVQVMMSPDGEIAVIQIIEGVVSVFPMWESLDELIALAKDCRVVRELTPEERAMYRLPEGP